MRYSRYGVVLLSFGLVVFGLAPAALAAPATIGTDVACFNTGAATVTITSDKEISNIVFRVGGEDTKIEFEEEEGVTAYSLTVGSGDTIDGLWVKAGNNKSGDGPGYGAKVLNQVIAGTSGNDTVATLNDGEVFCGGGGSDTVTTMNGGTFDGAPGSDLVTTMNGGTFNGGADNDQVATMISGTFEGRTGSDSVDTLEGGTFNGGADIDSVATMTGGTFNGGADGDTVTTMNGGTFNGRAANDSVDTLEGGTFNGGAADDTVTTMNGGIFNGGFGDTDSVGTHNGGDCINVESGC